MARQEFLERLADNHEIQIKKTLEDLEARIVSQISTVTEGADAVSTKIAIELRTDLKQYIDDTYRTTADTLVRDYDQIVNEFMEEFGGLDIPDKFKSLTKVDLLTINQLKFQQFAGFEDLANRYLNEISSQVYQNAIAGKPFNDIVKDLRGIITGDVDRRGQGAFLSSGSRRGIGMAQWSMARVNSFLRGSRKHDLDLRKKRKK